MNKRTDLVLVSFLQDQQEGETFVRNAHKGWPLHITLFPWFEALDADALDSELADIAKKTKPFDVLVGAEKMFGPNNDIPVNIIQDQTVLVQLHKKLNKVVTGEILESRWTGDGYNAHITQHAGAANVSEGDLVRVDHVYLVKLLDDETCLFLKKYTFEAGDENKT